MANQLMDNKLNQITPLSKIPDYNTFQQLLVVGNLGLEIGEFRYPRGIFIQEDTGHIYVSDTGNHRILMFFENGDFLKQFGDSHLDSPYSVLVHGRSVYVTDWGHHAIFIFSLPELFMIKKVDKIGHEKFKFPRNLAISPNQYFYMPSTDKDIIQILNGNLEIQSLLRHETMTRPIDLKFSTDQMFVLSDRDSPCVHIFTISGVKIRAIITRGIGMQVERAFFFSLDAHHNIIVSDNRSHQIKVFSLEGELQYTLGKYGHEPGMFNHPTGIAVLKHNKIACLSLNKGFSLQIFSAS